MSTVNLTEKAKRILKFEHNHVKNFKFIENLEQPNTIQISTKIKPDQNR